MSMRSLALLLVLAGLGATAGTAEAATRTIGFEELAAGATVTDQYRPDTATRFGRGLGGVQGNVLRTGTPPVGATPGARALTLTNCSGTSEFTSCVTDAWIQFERPQRSVGFLLGFLEAGTGSVPLTATAVSANNTVVASVATFADDGVDRPVTLSVPPAEAAIAAIHLTAYTSTQQSGRRFLALDQLTVAVPDPPGPGLPPPTPTPELGLIRDGDAGELVLTEGGQAKTNLSLGRSGGSSGPVTFKVSAAPPGLQTELTPTATDGAEEPKVELELNANTDIGLTQGVVVVTATPSGPAVGSVPRSVSVPVRVQDGYDVDITGLWPFQAVNDPESGPRSGQTRAYTGVPLIAGKKTVVRVYARARFAARPVPGVRVHLIGTRNGQPLPGSPLASESPLPLMFLGPGALGDEPIENQLLGLTPPGSGVPYSFTLPAAWSSGDVNLRAEILAPEPPASVGPRPEQAPFPCCGSDTAELTGLAFQETRRLQIAAIKTFWKRSRNGASQSSTPLPDDAAALFSAARAVTPLSDADFQLLGPKGWSGELDLSGAASQPGKDGADAQNDAAYAALWSFEQQRALNEHGKIGDVTIAVVDRIARGLESFEGFSFVPPGDEFKWATYFKPIAVTSAARPLTSIGHELGHALSRDHADNGTGGGIASCDGDKKKSGGADPGYPRGDGGLGTDRGLDPRGLFAPANRVIDPAGTFDLMSYCAGSNEGAAWISAYGWRQTLDGDPRNFSPFFFERGLRATTGARVAGPTPTTPARAAAAGPRAVRAPRRPTQAGVGILALRNPGGAITSLTTAESGAGGTQPTDPSGTPVGVPVTASFLDARGRARGSARLTVRRAHRDADTTRPASVVEVLSGAVPQKALAGSRSLVLRQGRRTLGRRSVGRFGPRVSVRTPKSPKRGTFPARLLLRYRASDRDRQALRITVDVTRNAGRTWRTIYGGPARRSVRLDSATIPTGRKVRLRVRASDGFRTGAATTRPFARR